MATAPVPASEWSARARALEPRALAFIDGKYVAAASGRTFDAISPIDGRVAAKVAECDRVDVDRAVAAARRSFEDGRWASAPPAHRKKVLVKLAALMAEHAEELALLETVDMGKPIQDAVSVDVAGSVRTVAWYGEAIDKVYGEIAPTAPNALGLISREPVGVVAAVVPWNFPLMMACWKIAPALAAGNSVVLKPAEQSPLTAIRLAQLASEAGIPDGVLNVVPGFGETAGAALGLHMDVDAIAFTGSTEIGKLFLKYAGESNLKLVSVECGGKSPNIVFADCPDLDAAARAAAEGIFFNQGEVCSAGSRLLVDRRVREDFLAKVAAHARTMAPGDPLDPATRLGAMVSKEHMQRVLGFISEGGGSGARNILGGRQVRQETGGYYIEPTIFADVDPASRLAQEEVFGPVLASFTFGSVDEAIALANNTRYGLGAGVWTSNLNVAHRLSRTLRAGSVWINCYDTGDTTVPFGGFKQSGTGRDKSLHALLKYTQLKTTWIALQ
jgi:gamma-glutamyl-gamma-aminobutyraldehyde dehydrogenase/4-guanidinobutyraldehyde dehydrogenase/NAD-dependent aldehyde dehydrogenase